MEPAYTLLTFASAGLFLKIADDHGEEGNSPLSYAAALIAGGLFWLLAKEDQYTSAVILSVVIGCLASLKVDQLNLAAGLIFLALLMGVMGFAFPTLPPLVMLAAAAYLDELCHDRHWKASWINLLFRYRVLLKGAVILLAMFGLLTPLSAVGLIVFDFSYDLTGFAVRRVKLTSRVGGAQPVELGGEKGSKLV